jgi:hypothetical protein
MRINTAVEAENSQYAASTVSQDMAIDYESGGDTSQ